MAAAPVLKTWDQIKGNPGDWPAILIGNGASMNVSSTFDYKSLFDRACKLGDEHQLDDVDRALFTEIGTVDFELVLAHLRQTLLVAKVLGWDKNHTDQVEAKYNRIHHALAAAVHSVHPQYGTIGDERLKQIGLALMAYNWVFSTNYDLIAYWAAMKAGINNFYDFLAGRPCRFRPENIGKAPADKTKLLFPHGALHLYVETDGKYEGIVHKRTRFEDSGILDQLFYLPEPPLVVAEGSADDKRQVIYSHKYLTFAFEQLGKVRDQFVIFGSDLGPTDAHIVEALEPKGRRIAVSIRASAKQGQKMARIRDVLSDADEVLFFSAETHPLGDPNLNVG
jgi:Domain of unknown function (DUF4917)